MAKTLTVKVARQIPASPAEAYDAWLDRKVPGTPWHENRKLILQPKVDGLFFWKYSTTPHYGRFTQLKRGSIIQHTWMSLYTNGRESVVTVRFKKKGDGTAMTLTHTGLPNNADGKGHDGGWTYFMDKFAKGF
jgi:uncharacterized protein YndB with AHSA1/START domain